MSIINCTRRSILCEIEIEYSWTPLKFLPNIIDYVRHEYWPPMMCLVFQCSECLNHLQYRLMKLAMVRIVV